MVPSGHIPRDAEAFTTSHESYCIALLNIVIVIIAYITRSSADIAVSVYSHVCVTDFIAQVIIYRTLGNSISSD